MIVSGGLALIWTDTTQGGGWTWPEVYRLMACLMVAAAVFSAIAVPRLAAAPAPRSSGRADVRGFLAVLAAVIAGYLVTDWLLAPASHRLLAPLATSAGMNPALAGKWIDLVALLGGIAVTVPMAMWAARRARFETLIDGLSNYFQQPGAVAILVLIVLYKLCDAFALSLMTPFLLQGMAFSSAEVGVINKVVGLWLTIMGALMGGALMLRLGLWRALFCFGLLQMASNLGFWWLAVHGKGALPGIMLPAFDWVIVRLTQATPVDGGLLLVVALDNLSGGMGTAAFLAFLTSLCNQRFTATQFALLSAFSSIGRVWVGPLAGVLAESVGWPTFFIVSTLVALPALWLLWRLRAEVRALDVPSGPVSADD
jgi:PAT family beta-lactamase induction signal transducer AmpG